MAREDRKRLDSWKDIARHLGRDVSTVRRWEKERSLPVRRLPGALRSAVFAYADEIDAWISGQRNGLEGELSQPPKKLVVRSLMAVCAVLALALTLFLGFNSFHPGLAETATYNGNKVIAWDASGERAWEYEFPYPLQRLSPEETARSVRFVDLDGDGKREVLAAPPSNPSGRQGTLSSTVYCFSHNGRLLWEFTPAFALLFGERRFEGPWDLSDLLVVSENGGPTLWASFVHHTWFPSIVFRLDRYGRGELRFVNEGWITKLGSVERRGGSYVLAGGANNEQDAGMLAVLDATTGAASSPSLAGIESLCRNCPRERPFRYFVFPRTELNTLERAAVNIVRFIEVSPSRIEVRTEEVPARKDFANLSGIYELSPELELRRVAATDNYWDFHRLLEDEQKIGHTHAVCRERMAQSPIRVWSAEAEWKDARVGDVAVSRRLSPQSNPDSTQ